MGNLEIFVLFISIYTIDGSEVWEFEIRNGEFKFFSFEIF
jgi:hypothetical protein